MPEILPCRIVCDDQDRDDAGSDQKDQVRRLGKQTFYPVGIRHERYDTYIIRMIDLLIQKISLILELHPPPALVLGR